MNIVKIQQELIKDVMNNKSSNWFIQIKDSEVYIMTRHQVYILDPKEFLLDNSKLDGVDSTNIADSLLKTADDAKPAVKTGITKSIVLGGKDVNCLELKREDNNELVYLDQALLKLYDKLAEFEVINGKSPVYIYESDILVGVVLPVKVG